MQLSFLLVALCLFPALVVPFPVQKVTGAEILQSYLGEPATADLSPEDGVLENLPAVATLDTLMETGSEVSASDADRWIAIHNKYRCMHGVPALKWSNAVAADAQSWADKGVFKHSNCYSLKPPAGPAGENLAMGHGSIEGASSGWYSEVKNCAAFPGCEKSKGGMIGHFTAMVWKGVKELGCGINKAKRLYVCRYKAGDRLSGDTPNMRGAYTKNVFAPSKSAAQCSASTPSKPTPSTPSKPTPITPSKPTPSTPSKPAPSPAAGCRMTLAGNPRHLKKAPAQCTAADAKLYVRCCSDSGKKVKMSTYGCNAGKTFGEAVKICSAKKLRVCTQAEIMKGLTSGTGCGYDLKRVWTSTTQGSSPAKPAPKPAPAPPAKPAPARGPTGGKAWECNGSDGQPATKFVATCKKCSSSIQCQAGFCCPYMKLCVPSSSHGCPRPIASCRGSLCLNKDYPNNWVTCPAGGAPAPAKPAPAPAKPAPVPASSDKCAPTGKCCVDAGWKKFGDSCKRGCWGCGCKDGTRQCGCAHCAIAVDPDESSTEEEEEKEKTETEAGATKVVTVGSSSSGTKTLACTGTECKPVAMPCTDKYSSCPRYKSKCWCPNISGVCKQTCGKCPAETQTLIQQIAELQLGAGESLKCPGVVSKANWEGSDTHGDQFRISISKGKLEAKRLDKNAGWGMNLRFKCSVVSGDDGDDDDDETPTPPAPKPPPPPAPTPTKPDDCKDAARTPYTWRGCSRYKAGTPVTCPQAKHWCNSQSWMKQTCPRTCDSCDANKDMKRTGEELLQVQDESHVLKGSRGEEVVFEG